jgi:hypothetical protein
MAVVIAHPVVYVLLVVGATRAQMLRRKSSVTMCNRHASQQRRGSAANKSLCCRGCATICTRLLLNLGPRLGSEKGFRFRRKMVGVSPIGRLQ